MINHPENLEKGGTVSPLNCKFDFEVVFYKNGKEQ